MSETAEAFENLDPTPTPQEERLVVSVDGFEGPLDLLLALARDQKVDLARISVLQLAEQYLAFMESVKKSSLELAADYLVMAAWLAYLKSKLMLPQPAATEGEPSALEMAARLRWQLQRLEAMRNAAARLMARERLDREVFARGAPEPIIVTKVRTQTDTLYDLLTAYSAQRVRQVRVSTYRPAHVPVLLIEEARARLERMLGRIGNWNALSNLLPAEWAYGQRRSSALASTLLACLELTRDGKVEMRQLQPFDEIYVKDREQKMELAR